MKKRTFTEEEDAMIRQARAGEVQMTALREHLRTSFGRIYERMAELGLQPHRKGDRRTRPVVKRDYLKLVPKRATGAGAAR